MFLFLQTCDRRERRKRAAAGKEKVIMVDAALFAIRELMEDHPECIFRTGCWPQAWWCFS